MAAETFTTEDLEEALRAIASTISKCEKVQPKLKQGTSQHTLLVRRIKALRIAATLITRELKPPKRRRVSTASAVPRKRAPSASRSRTASK